MATKKTAVVTPPKPQSERSLHPVVVAVMAVPEPVLTSWDKVPLEIRIAFNDMRRALINLPHMQSAHGLDCKCRWCVAIEEALAAAEAAYLAHSK